jgi:hypothetical protein
VITQAGSVGNRRTGAAATDVYDVECATTTKYLSVQVMDLAPVNPAQVSIQATKGTSSSTLSIDGIDGDANYSPLEKLDGGQGHYMMKINKSASDVIGAELYKAQFYCRDANGKETETQWEIKQNQ